MKHMDPFSGEGAELFEEVCCRLGIVGKRKDSIRTLTVRFSIGEAVTFQTDELATSQREPEELLP